jgi:hypothetical protein
MSLPAPQPAFALIDRFRWIWKQLFLGLGDHSRPVGITVVYARMIFHRLCYLRRAFDQAYARGIIAPTPPRAPRPPTPSPDPRPEPPPPPEHILPRCHNWLLRMLPNADVANGRLHLIEALNTPELQPIIESNAAMRRVLRSLCHMLGVTQPPSLRLLKRARPAKPAPTAKPTRQRRILPPRPSPFPVPPRPPTPFEQQWAFQRMFGRSEFST